MPATSAEDQLRFLMCCVRNAGGAGKVSDYHIQLLLRLVYQMLTTQILGRLCCRRSRDGDYQQRCCVGRSTIDVLAPITDD